MDSFEATGIVEGFVKCNSAEMMIEAWQYLVDTDMCWELQGWFGRAAKELLLNGTIKATTEISKRVLEGGWDD